MDLLDKFKTILSSNKYIEKGDRIVLAVSGGLDSVVLLHLFCQLKEYNEIELSIIHVHHGIRGEEAERDLKFVYALAEKYQIPFYFRKVDAKQFAAENKKSLEESARELRYQAFEEVLNESHSTKLATAHTANDQVETIIDHLLRGSGIRGLRGIPNVRGRYFRPLITFSRQDLASYIQQNQLDFYEDSTNQDLNFKRNRIRNELIPYLIKNFNPNLISTICRMGVVFEENELFLKEYANKAFNSIVSSHKKNEIILDIVGFLNYFEIVQKYVIFKGCEILNIDRKYLSFEKLERILFIIKQKKIGRKVDINQQFEIIIDHDGIVIKKHHNNSAILNFDLKKDSSCRYDKYELHWQVLNKPARMQFSDDKNIEIVDFNKTGGVVSLRNLQPGDRFHPINFTGRKKVADYFSDQKVPHHLREETPILEASKGIVWICGHRLDDRFKVTNKTTRILKLELVEKIHAI